MKTYIIAEIGINHNGDINMAKEMIKWASVCGCDAVKFQKRNPDVCVPEHQKNVIRDTPWGKMTYLDYKKKIEFGKDEYDIIDRECMNWNIDWSASPWDKDSLNFLEQYDLLPWIKIPSALITNTELVREAAISVAHGQYHTLIISTGMSSEEEIDEAVDLIQQYLYDKNNSRGTLVIMHCNSTYPAPIDELNLSCIRTLKQKYGHYNNVSFGYSGHEFQIGTTVASIFLGATYIERHITIDRTLWGTDQLCSVEPQGLLKMVKGIRELERAFGDGVIGVTESELPVRKKLRGE